MDFNQLRERIQKSTEFSNIFTRDGVPVLVDNFGEEYQFSDLDALSAYLDAEGVPSLVPTNQEEVDTLGGNGEPAMQTFRKPSTYPEFLPWPPMMWNDFGDGYFAWTGENVDQIDYDVVREAYATEKTEKEGELSRQEEAELDRQEDAAFLLDQRRAERLTREAAEQTAQEKAGLEARNRLQRESELTKGLTFETADQARETQKTTPGLENYRLSQSPTTGRFVLTPPFEEEDDTDFQETAAPTNIEGLMTQAWNRGDMAAFNKLSQARTSQQTAQPSALDNLKLAAQFAQSGVDADTLQKYFNFIQQAQGQQFGAPTGLENFGSGPTTTSPTRFGADPSGGVVPGLGATSGQQLPFGAVDTGQQQATSGIGAEEFQQWLDASRFREGGPPSDMPTAREEFMEKFAPTPTDMELYGDLDVRTNLAIATQGMSPKDAAEYERQYWIRQRREGTGQFESVEGRTKRRAKELGVAPSKVGFTPGQQMAFASHNVNKLKKEAEAAKQAGIQGLVDMFPKKTSPIRQTGANIAKIYQTGGSAGKRF